MLHDDTHESQTLMAGRTGELLREVQWHTSVGEEALSCFSNEGWNYISM